MAGRKGSSPFAQTLYCPVAVSAQLNAFNDYIHAAACAVVLVLAVYRAPLAASLLPVALSYWHCRRRLQLRRRDSVVELRWFADERCAWQTCGGNRQDGRLASAMVCSCWLVLLRLRRRTGGIVMVPLAMDSLPKEVHRRLRARLMLWQPQTDRGLRAVAHAFIRKFRSAWRSS